MPLLSALWSLLMLTVKYWLIVMQYVNCIIVSFCFKCFLELRPYAEKICTRNILNQVKSLTVHIPVGFSVLSIHHFDKYSMELFVLVPRGLMNESL